jgi:allantoicase
MGCLLTLVRYDLQPMDFACVETQIGNGDAADCEVIELRGEGMIIQVP